LTAAGWIRGSTPSDSEGLPACRLEQECGVAAGTPMSLAVCPVPLWGQYDLRRLTGEDSTCPFSDEMRAGQHALTVS